MPKKESGSRLLFHAASTFLRFFHILPRLYRRFPLRLCRKPCPQVFEKRLQKRLCLLGTQTAFHHRMVVEGHGEQVGHAAAAALRQMEAQRRPLYLAAADAVIPNNGTLDEALRAALEALDEIFDS